MAKELSKFAHPAYVKALPDYRIIRDCFDGQRAIKAAGTAYLPQLTGQIQSDYDNYRNRALFFPITGKTVTTMVGMATTKPPKTTYPEGLKRYFVDTYHGYQFTELYVSIFTEITLMGRYGVLIDAPKLGGKNLLFVGYIAENIINWRHDAEGHLTSLLLREYRLEELEGFETNTVCQYRHLFIRNGVYYQQVLNEDLKAVDLEIAPMFSGNTIDYIPFTPFGSTGVHFDVDRQPMLDIATINISHYMTSADLEWGRHIAGLPTPVITGADSSTKLSIGGTSAWALPQADCKAFYLEFLGQGLQSLEKAMVEKVGLMASVSARLIDNSTRGSEAAETVRLRYMSESASLIHIINSNEIGLNVLYNMLAKLEGESGPVQILFSREIIGIGIKFTDLKILFEAYANSQISKETLIYNLRRLEAIDPNRSDVDEMEAIHDPVPLLDPNKPPAAIPLAPKPAN